MAGLTAAAALRRRGVPVRLFEAGPAIGGLASSVVDDEGYTYDFGAHFITNRLAAEIGVGAQCRDVVEYGEAVYLRGRSYSYPFGLVASPRYAASAIRERLRRNGTGGPAASAADWLRRTYGPALAAEVAMPLMEAWSGAPAEDLSAAVGDKFASSIVRTMWLKAAGGIVGRAVASGYCRERPESVKVWHVYPEGGVSLLARKLAGEVESVVEVRSPVDKILVEGERVVGVRVNGREIEASAVLSTAPVHILARLVEGTEAVRHLAQFRYRPMIFVNLRLQGRALLPDVVTWIPERRFPFFRVTEGPRSMPWTAPPGRTMLTVDIGCEQEDAVWSMADEQLGELCVEHLRELVPDVRQRYRGCRVLRTPIAYPVYLRAYERERRALESGTGVAGLHTIGRNGEFAHILLEDLYWRTLRVADRVAASYRVAAPAAVSD